MLGAPSDGRGGSEQLRCGKCELMRHPTGKYLHSMSSDRVPARLHHRATGRVSNALAQPRRNRVQAGGSGGGLPAIWSAAVAACSTGCAAAGAGAAAGACGACCCWSKKLEQTKLEAGAACVQHQQLVAACHAVWVLEGQRLNATELQGFWRPRQRQRRRCHR